MGRPVDRTIDWGGLMRAGLHGLGLRPEEFWRLSPVELRIMLGRGETAAPLTRVRLEELARAFPDRIMEAEDERDRDAGRDGGGARAEPGRDSRGHGEP